MSNKHKMAVWTGQPYPLGAVWDGLGVNFSLFSENATKVELCIMDASGRHEVERITMPDQTDQIWHAYLPEARPGLLYGYRVHGPYKPEEGHRFNPNKFLLDPYAKVLEGTIRWNDRHFGYEIDHPDEDLSFDKRDNVATMPRCEVIETAFTWGDDRKPKIPWHDTIVYEVHVRGFTIQHPDVPVEQRGTYAAMGSAPVIEYLKRLGITTVELLPVHACVDDRHLVEKGLSNYWGYNSIGFFAPTSRYAATAQQVSEFKTMVKALHKAEIEVILDVVYNHTAEGSHMGPTLSFRGIDNAAYYRTNTENPRYYMDFTGCGNTLNMRHPRVLQLMMDSLRYWVTEMHVDGFRFDLCSALARELYEVDRLAAFFDVIGQDPILSQVKLIAEPWDIGDGGYQVGNFPVGWTEWNGKYRDTMRAYWKGDESLIGDMAYRLTGSSDLYENSGRRPYASINFITCHDGFTLQDLVSFNDKHNEANFEDNRDGTDHNLSWNCGVEGFSDDPKILTVRAQQKRNMLATLLFSQGVPMLLAGDETGNTQGGNNNGYCQDSPMSWIDWDINEENARLFDFTQKIIALSKAHPVFRRQHFFQGRSIRGHDKDIIWLTPEGDEMSDETWNQSHSRCIGLLLAGEVHGEVDYQGHPIKDDNFLLLLNAHHEDLDFHLLTLDPTSCWRPILDTYEEVCDGVPEITLSGGDTYLLHARSLALLQQIQAQRN